MEEEKEERGQMPGGNSWGEFPRLGGSRKGSGPVAWDRSIRTLSKH